MVQSLADFPSFLWLLFEYGVGFGSVPVRRYCILVLDRGFLFVLGRRHIAFHLLCFVIGEYFRNFGRAWNFFSV